MITFLRSIFNWKLLVVLLGAAIIGGVIWYGLSLQEQLAQVETEYQNVMTELVQTEEQAAVDLAGYQSDIQAYESSIKSIRDSLVDAQVARTRLEDTLDEAGENDETLQECFSKELPASVLDSLY